MSIERMADRALPLTERVEAALIEAGEGKGIGGAHVVTLMGLLADVAAADELARAAETLDRTTRAPMGSRLIGKLPAAIVDRREALAAYRARMAQGVADV